MILLANVRGEGLDDFEGKLVKWLIDSTKRLNDAVVETARNVSEKGENITKYRIETSGIAKSGKRGRVESGRMRDAVSSSTSLTGVGSARAEFGWLHWEDREPYFMYQDRGFTHYKSKEYIEGMYALADAADEVVADLKEDLKRKIDDV